MRVKIGIIVGIAGAIQAGCSGGPPSHENRELPGLTCEGDPALVRDAARDALKNAGFVIEEENETALTSPLAQDRGFTWTLKVTVRSELGSVHVTPVLDIHRQYAFRPLRVLGQNMSGAVIDDARLEGGNGRAYAHDREMIEGEDDRENSEREHRIDEVTHRVSIFLAGLENQLSKPK